MTLCTKAKKKLKRKYSSILPYARQLLVQELRVSERGTAKRANSQKCVTQQVFFPHKKKGGKHPKGAQLKTFSRVVMINNLLMKVELLSSPVINVEKVL